MLTKNADSYRLFRLPLAFLLLGVSVLLVGCDDRPTAEMKVIVTFDNCTTEYTTALRANGEPVTKPDLLSAVNDEIESQLGCELQELEYAFNTNPLVGKIELDVGETGEVTAFVPLNNTTPLSKPFVINTPNFKSVSVEVLFPDANTPSLRGSVRVSK